MYYCNITLAVETIQLVLKVPPIDITVFRNSVDNFVVINIMNNFIFTLHEHESLKMFLGQ